MMTTLMVRMVATIMAIGNDAGGSDSNDNDNGKDNGNDGDDDGDDDNNENLVPTNAVTPTRQSALPSVRLAQMLCWASPCMNLR